MKREPGPVTPRQAQVEAFLAREEREEAQRKRRDRCDREGHVYTVGSDTCVRCGHIPIEDIDADDIPF